MYNVANKQFSSIESFVVGMFIEFIVWRRFHALALRGDGPDLRAHPPSLLCARVARDSHAPDRARSLAGLLRAAAFPAYARLARSAASFSTVPLDRSNDSSSSDDSPRMHLLRCHTCFRGLHLPRVVPGLRRRRHLGVLQLRFKHGRLVLRRHVRRGN